MLAITSLKRCVPLIYYINLTETGSGNGEKPRHYPDLGLKYLINLVTATFVIN